MARYKKKTTDCWKRVIILGLENLKDLVTPIKNDSTYFRPFVRDKTQTDYEIFFAGINPATSISTEDLDIDKYVSLLENYDEFYKEYQKIRDKKGKNHISRSRLGTINFLKDLKEQTGREILETNVIPYPTSNIKELKKKPSDIKKRARELFYLVLIEYTPKVIIVYGKTALEYLVENLAEHEIIAPMGPITKKLRQIENSEGPFLTFEYPDGKRGAVFACRHMMYHGKDGNSFSNFKEKIISYIMENN